MLYSLAVLSSDLEAQKTARLENDLVASPNGRSHICLPPKMRRCCAGGMPSFSSTLSLMRSTWPREETRQGQAGCERMHAVQARYQPCRSAQYRFQSTMREKHEMKERETRLGRVWRAFDASTYLLAGESLDLGNDAMADGTRLVKTRHFWASKVISP